MNDLSIVKVSVESVKSVNWLWERINRKTERNDMLVVALRALFLIGVMSWYSAAIMSMINDYFRAEFTEYLQKDPIPSSVAPPKTNQESSKIVITSPTQQQQHHHPQTIENLFDSIDNTNNDQQQQHFGINELAERNGCGSVGSSSGGIDIENSKTHCDKDVISMRLLFGKSNHSYDVCVSDSRAWMVEWSFVRSTIHPFIVHPMSNVDAMKSSRVN